MTELINNGASLKINQDGNSRLVMKHQIAVVEVLHDTIIRIDIGKGALNNVFIDQADVTNPVTISPEELRDKIMDMLQTSAANGSATNGLATEAKQTEQTTELQNVKNAMTDIKDKIASVNDKLLFEPRISDETNANVIYKGFANPNTKTSEPVWAIQKITNNRGMLTIQWAGGNKNSDKVWDKRKEYIFS
jgi:phosphomevalonate kinase